MLYIYDDEINIYTKIIEQEEIQIYKKKCEEENQIQDYI